MIFTVHQPMPTFAQGTVLAGVDEAGRGPLAGPVAAAAVVLDPDFALEGLADSKALSAARREQLAGEIETHALSWAVSFAEPDEIDALNILHATMAAMARAVEQLSCAPTLALIDGNRVPGLRCEAHAVIKGDARVACISAASILAKVWRDRRMVELHEQYPQYGFAQHKGYPTRAHRDALKAHGPTPQHRRSFAPVREAERCG